MWPLEHADFEYYVGPNKICLLDLNLKNIDSIIFGLHTLNKIINKLREILSNHPHIKQKQCK